MFNEVSFKMGMNFEPHSQNLCIETDANLKPTGRFVIRDFGGVWPDIVSMLDQPQAAAYMDAANADKFKFSGARVNYVESYAFFYKRQVFDMMSDLLVTRNVFTKSDRSELEDDLGKIFVRLLNASFNAGLLAPPNMSTRGQAKELILRNARFNPGGLREVKSDARFQAWISRKDAALESVQYLESRSTPGLRFHETRYGVIATQQEAIIAFYAFNAREFEDYSKHSDLNRIL